MLNFLVILYLYFMVFVLCCNIMLMGFLRGLFLTSAIYLCKAVVVGLGVEVDYLVFLILSFGCLKCILV